MQKIKKSEGITLITLVVTIIVFMIILTIIIDNSLDSSKESRDKKLEAELQIIQQACIIEYQKAKELGYIKEDSGATSEENIPDNFIGTVIPVNELPSVDGAWVLTSEPNEGYKKYFELTPDDLKQLSISDSKYTYIVNYYTGEVYNATRKNKQEVEEPLYIKSSINREKPAKSVDTNFIDENF